MKMLGCFFGTQCKLINECEYTGCYKNGTPVLILAITSAKLYQF